MSIFYVILFIDSFPLERFEQAQKKNLFILPLRWCSRKTWEYRPAFEEIEPVTSRVVERMENYS